jgi:transposase-like protein
MSNAPQPGTPDDSSSQHPGDETATRTSDEPRCPFCGSPDVEPMALFGSQLMTQQFYCRDCRTPFERVRDGT